MLEATRGCAPAKVWKAKFPLGLDMLVLAIVNTRRRSVCKFFCEMSEVSGTTHEQRLSKWNGNAFFYLVGWSH